MDSTEPPVARQISLYAVIRSILSHGPTSRADLAKRTGLSKQTISDVVFELETAGWVKPHGRTSGKPGRSAVVYEINAMAGWLKGKKQPVPIQATNVRAAGDAHHGSMPGMATAAQLEELAEARGVDADRLFLQRMIAHHEGALTMASTQQRDGTDEYVGDLSSEVYVTQSVQIAAMKDMLTRLS